MEARPPVIVIGMHRSGTSMITRVLEEFGLFMGWRREHNDEALFFQALNEWILRQAGVSWDRPEGFSCLLKDDAVLRLLTDILTRIVKTPRAISFLGPLRYIRYRTPFKIDRPWGWKDPRNTMTLPVWLGLFPDARIIHVRRHGVDVAASLKVREDRRLSKVSHRLSQLGLAYSIWLKSGATLGSVRCSQLEGGLSLWEEYMGLAGAHVAQLGERAMDIQYEAFLERPHDTLSRLQSFLDVNADQSTLDSIAARTNPNRSYAHRHDPELAQFASGARNRLAIYGY